MRRQESLYVGKGPRSKYGHHKEREKCFHSNRKSELQIVKQQTPKNNATQKPYHDDDECIHHHQEYSAEKNIGDDGTNHNDTGYESYGVNPEKEKFTIDYSLLEKISRRKLLPSRVIYLQDKKLWAAIVSLHQPNLMKSTEKNKIQTDGTCSIGQNDDDMHIRSFNKSKTLGQDINSIKRASFTQNTIDVISSGLNTISNSISTSNPQGNRPNEILVGMFESKVDAIAAGYVYAPPIWKGSKEISVKHTDFESNFRQCTGNSTKLICFHCKKQFRFLRRIHHCRNCGDIFCASCSSTKWSTAMIPFTYHNSERSVRVCKSCDHLSKAFRYACLEGDMPKAYRLYTSYHNLNLWNPFVSDKDVVHQEGQNLTSQSWVTSKKRISEYPIHAAARGGSLDLLQWLIDDLRCPMYITGCSMKKKSRSMATSDSLKERTNYYQESNSKITMNDEKNKRDIDSFKENVINRNGISEYDNDKVQSTTTTASTYLSEKINPKPLPLLNQDQESTLTISARYGHRNIMKWLVGCKKVPLDEIQSIEVLRKALSVCLFANSKGNSPKFVENDYISSDVNTIISSDKIITEAEYHTEDLQDVHEIDKKPFTEREEEALKIDIPDNSDLKDKKSNSNTAHNQLRVASEPRNESPTNSVSTLSSGISSTMFLNHITKRSKLKQKHRQEFKHRISRDRLSKEGLEKGEYLRDKKSPTLFIRPESENDVKFKEVECTICRCPQSIHRTAVNISQTALPIKETIGIPLCFCQTSSPVVSYPPLAALQSLDLRHSLPLYIHHPASLRADNCSYHKGNGDFTERHYGNCSLKRGKCNTDGHIVCPNNSNISLSCIGVHQPYTTTASCPGQESSSPSKSIETRDSSRSDESVEVNKQYDTDKGYQTTENFYTETIQSGDIPKQCCKAIESIQQNKDSQENNLFPEERKTERTTRRKPYRKESYKKVESAKHFISIPAISDLIASEDSEAKVESPVSPSAPPLPPPETFGQRTDSSTIPPMTNRSQTTTVGECVVCMEKKSDVILIPCGHLCCCTKCATYLDSECPVCREKVEKIQKVYRF